MDLTAGTLVTPSVRLARPLRRGGMGEVWVADHLALRTQVVVKFLGDGFAEQPANVARFHREAAAAAQVKSPHVVQTLDFGVTPGGTPYIVMELLEGLDLAQVLKNKPLTLAETAHVVEGIARALTKAHERGIVHRDIKPANIFVCDAGTGEPFVKIVDFGIAKGIDDHNPVTSTGDVVGTPTYMSPEQLNGGRDVDHQTDLWSTGVVAYRCLVGASPFQGENVGAVAIAVLSAPLPVPSRVNPALPPSFDAWFARACSRDKAYRFRSAREMADALWAIAEGRARIPAAPSSHSGSARRGAFGVSGEVPAVAEPTGTTRATSIVTGGPAHRASNLRTVLAGAMGALVAGSVVALLLVDLSAPSAQHAFPGPVDVVRGAAGQPSTETEPVAPSPAKAESPAKANPPAASASPDAPLPEQATSAAADAAPALSASATSAAVAAPAPPRPAPPRPAGVKRTNAGGQTADPNDLGF